MEMIVYTCVPSFSGLLRRSKTGVLVNKKPDYAFNIKAFLTYHYLTYTYMRDVSALLRKPSSSLLVPTQMHSMSSM